MARPKEGEWVKVQVRLQADVFAVVQRLAKGMGITPNMMLRLMVQSSLPNLESLAKALEQRDAGQESQFLAALLGVGGEMHGLLAGAEAAIQEKQDALESGAHAERSGS